MAQQGLVLNVGPLNSQIERLKDGLDRLPPAVQRRIGRSAVSRGIRPVAKRLKRLQTEYSSSVHGTGQLARSIGVKTGTSRRKESVFGLAGARKGGRWRQLFLLPAGRRKRAVNVGRALLKGRKLPSRGIQVWRWPQKYFHLVEGGFRHRSGAAVPGARLLLRAWSQTERLAQSIIRTAVADGLSREAAKIRAKTK